MKRVIAALLLTLTALAASEYADIFKDYKGTLRIAGGTAHIPVMKTIAKEIASVNPDLRVAIAGGGSGVG